MLKTLIKDWFKKEQRKREPIYIEDILYNEDVYPIYCEVQNNFKFCMQNRLLKRCDVLEFKDMLNKFVNQNEFKHEKFKNDAHEIYRKLKSISISKHNMLILNDYLSQYLVVIPEPVKVYKNLRVIK